MEFARRQLEKYGWSDGKGLGRREDGIAQALRPRLKRSAAGVGHDPAAEHNNHWWSALYDAAAANVEVKGANGKTKRISTRDPDAVVISDKSWRIRKKRPEQEAKSPGYMEHFVKTAVLASGGVRTERLVSNESSDEDMGSVHTGRLTDEQLLAACGGRTAHKGARHGLRAKGKLARIEEQEKELLKLARYEGYSQASASGTQEQSSEIHSKHIADKCENDGKHNQEKRKRNRKDTHVDDTFDETVHNSQKDETALLKIPSYEIDEDGTNYKKKRTKNKGAKGFPIAKTSYEKGHYSQKYCVEKDLNELVNNVGLNLNNKNKPKKRKLASQGEHTVENKNENNLEISQEMFNETLNKDVIETCEVMNHKKLRKKKSKGTVKQITREIVDDNVYWDNIYEKQKLGNVNMEDNAACLYEITDSAEIRKKSKKNKRQELSVNGESIAENSNEYQTSDTLQDASKSKKKVKTKVS